VAQIENSPCTQRARPAFWALAAGLFALALDERFMFHERLKWLILGRLFDYDRAAMGAWGNLLMALIPLAGGARAARGSSPRSRSARWPSRSTSRRR
jgi:hypothetical protein